MTIISKNERRIPYYFSIMYRIYETVWREAIAERRKRNKGKRISSPRIVFVLDVACFSGENLYTLLEICSEKTAFTKDTECRLLNNALINRESFMIRLSCAVIPEVRQLTADECRTALIIDDSPY